MPDNTAAATPKRSWWIDKKHVLHCFSSPANDCLVHSLVDLPEVSGFYDPELGRATQEINGVFAALAGRKGQGRELAVIVLEGRPLLAWTQPSRVGRDEDGAIGPDDDPDTIRQALRLTGAKAVKRTWAVHGNDAACWADPANNCVVSKFGELVEPPGSFYDADVARATREVNGILDKLREAKDPDRELSFIVVESALLLIWTRPGIGPNSEPRLIREAFGLRG